MARTFALMDGKFREANRDEKSRGSAYWKAHTRRLERLFRKSTGDGRLQAICDAIHQTRIFAEDCLTYGPCSRECV